MTSLPPDHTAAPGTLYEPGRLEERQLRAYYAVLNDDEQFRNDLRRLYAELRPTISQALSAGDGLEFLMHMRAAIQAEIDRLADRQALYEANEQQIRTAEALLADLRARLDAGLDEETRQTVVRALVRKIVIRTEGEGRDRTAKAVVDYAFAEPNGFLIGNSRTGAGRGSPARGGA
jgi:hypothetical protein